MQSCANTEARVGKGMSFGPEFDAGFRARLHELLRWRRDVRHFRQDRLPPGAIERLIEIACLAPSVGLSQPWRFVLVEAATPARLSARILPRVTGRHWPNTAPTGPTGTRD